MEEDLVLAVEPEHLQHMLEMTVAPGQGRYLTAVRLGTNAETFVDLVGGEQSVPGHVLHPPLLVLAGVGLEYKVTVSATHSAESQTRPGSSGGAAAVAPPPPRTGRTGRGRAGRPSPFCCPAGGPLAAPGKTPSLFSRKLVPWEFWELQN